MPILFITADNPGAASGGGRVTSEELKALEELRGHCGLSQEVQTIRPHWDASDPFRQDRDVLEQVKSLDHSSDLKLCHVYAGPFNLSLEYLKSLGYTVTFTVAAHDVPRSVKAHHDLGLPFPFKHLTDQFLFGIYTRGYREIADVVIVPGQVPGRTVRRQGRTGPVEIIPHGCDVPDEIRFTPSDKIRFGYLGAIGADKGLLTFARAWRRVQTFLGSGKAEIVLGGKDSPHALGMFGNKDARALGWVPQVRDFYDAIDVYVQPSNTEGFGIEVIEALSHGRPVLCSDQAGAVDAVSVYSTFVAGDDEQLGCLMLSYYQNLKAVRDRTPLGRVLSLAASAGYAWPKIRKQYVKLWKSLLNV